MKNHFKSYIERADKILGRELSPEEKLSQIMKIAHHFSESIEEKVGENENIKERVLETVERYTRLAEENKVKGSVDVQQMNYRIAEVVSSLLIEK